MTTQRVFCVVEVNIKKLKDRFKVIRVFLDLEEARSFALKLDIEKTPTQTLWGMTYRVYPATIRLALVSL